MTEAELTPDQLQIAFHDVECRMYDERFAITHSRRTARRVAREVLRVRASAEPLGRTLDVGCGTGYVGLALAATGAAEELHLVDISPGMLSRAVANAADLGVDASIVRASARALPFANGRFDTVVARGVLHHLDDVEAALTEWRRVLRRGGRVVLLSEPTAAADRLGGAAARAALRALPVARRLAAAAGRPLSARSADEAAEQDYWDLVAMAANLHTFDRSTLTALADEAGYRSADVRAAGLVAILWAAVYYVLVGQLPGLAGSARARGLAGRTFDALAWLDRVIVEPLAPRRLRLTVRGVLRA